MYAVYHGPEGLTRIAQRTHRLTDILAAGLERLGFAIENESWFDTLTVRAPGAAEAILNRAEAAGYNLRPIDGDRLGIACDETTARADIEAVWRAFAGEADPQFDVAALDGEARCGLPKNLARQTPFLEHPVFNLYHAETELLRYMRRLGRPGPDPQSGHDPARLLHHEAQRDRRDDADSPGPASAPSTPSPRQRRRRATANSSLG